MATTDDLPITYDAVQALASAFEREVGTDDDLSRLPPKLGGY